MNLVLVWVVATLIAALLMRKPSQKHKEALASKLPGPRGLPLIGVAYLFRHVTNPEGILRLVLNLTKDYGIIFRAWLGSILLISIKDSKQTAKIVSGQQALNKEFIYTFFKVGFDGVFSSNGARWRELRGMLNQTMRHNMLEEYMTAFNKTAIRFCSKLERSSGVFKDPLEDTGNAMIDLALHTHWGVDGNELERNEGNLLGFSERLFEMVFTRTANFFLHFDAVFKLHPSYFKLERLRKYSFKFLRKKITERQQLKEEEDKLEEGDPRKRKTVYLDMVKEWAASHGKENESEYLERAAWDVLVGVSDTTSVAICQMFYHMARDPEIQRKMHEEIDAIFSDDPNRLVTKDDLKKMKYTEMVMNETLRHYCPPNIARSVTEDVHTEYGVIPVGGMLFVPLFMYHRDPEVWEKPEEFYPEHFLPEVMARRPRSAFMPFMTGPRSCPGKFYAYWIVKVIMAHVLRKFKVETDMKDVRLKFTIMVSPEDGFSLKFTPRSTIN